MSEYFENNLKLLETVNPELAARLAARHFAKSSAGLPNGWSAKLTAAKSGAPVIELADETGKSIALSSRYEPVREATQIIEKHRPEFGERNFYAVIGFGMGYHVDELMLHIPPDSTLVIVEASEEVFYLAMSARDLSLVLSHPKLAIAASGNVEHAGDSIGRLFDLMKFKGLHVIEWEYYSDTPLKPVMNEYMIKLRAQLLQVAGNFQTMMAMGQAYTQNSLINFKYLVKDPVFNNLRGKFAGVPGIVVSAGPSLNKNAHLLKEIGNRGVVCAVDTAVKPLMKMGITPHIVATGDPQEANYKHLKSVRLPETYLICDPQAPPKTVSEWAGGRFFCSFGTRFFAWFDSRIDVGHVNVWGSVATIAYDIVLQMGCDPIIFIGQDLAFSWGRTYVKGTYFEDDDGKDMSVEDFVKTNQKVISRTDIYGNEVFTNRQMFAYCEFLLRRFAEPHGRRIINATEGGILKSENVETTTFRDAIDEHLKGGHDIAGMLAEAHSRGNGFRLPYLASEMDDLIGEFRRLLKASSKGYDYSKKLDELIETEDPYAQEVRDVYNKMVRLRKEIDGLVEAKPFLEMLNQAGLYKYFCRLKEIVLEEGKVDKPALKQMNDAFGVLFATCATTGAQLLPLFENARDELRDEIERLDRTAHAVAPGV